MLVSLACNLLTLRQVHFSKLFRLRINDTVWTCNGFAPVT